jgi:ABC-type Fe3+ transport system substrate-binding protein
MAGWTRIVSCIAACFIAASTANAASQALIDAAKREGRVTWYTTLLVDDASGPLAAAFEKKYGIDVDFKRRDGAIQLRTILDEAKSGTMKVDVFDGTTTAAFVMKEGLAEAYKADTASDIPAEYKDPNGYWTAQVLYFQTLGYNPDLVPANEVPKSYRDLLDPKWKGRLAWTAEEQLTGGLGFIVNVIATMGEREGMEFLAALAKQDLVRLRDGINGVTVALAAKRYPIGITVDNHHTVIANEKGGNVKWFYFEPVLGLSNNIGLIKGAPHPNAGKLLIDYILSVEGQTVLRAGHHIPSSSKVDPAVRELKGGFKVNYISPAQGVVQTEKARAIYRQLFEQR